MSLKEYIGYIKENLEVDWLKFFYSFVLGAFLVLLLENLFDKDFGAVVVYSLVIVAWKMKAKYDFR